MNRGLQNVTLNTHLDLIYFNNDKTQLQECLNLFLNEDISYYRLAQQQSRQTIIDDFFNGYKNFIHPELYLAFSSNLNKAVSSVFGDDPNDRFSELRENLTNNVSRFAAYKAYQCSIIMDRQRASSDGEVLPKKEFELLAKKVLSTFNRWQAAEYNTAVSRARTAKQFTIFNDPENVRLFSCLRWIPSRSVKQRDIHKPFYNLVLPKDHPFWQSNQPGNLWNCKCDWEETNDEQSKGYPKTRINSPGLEGNPATTGEIFTNNASYIKKVTDKKVVEKIENLFKGFQYIQKAQLQAAPFDKKCKNIAEELGIKVTPISLKKYDRIVEKAENDYGGNILKVKDLVRNTFVTEDKLFDNVLLLLNKNFDVISVKRQDTPEGYTGILVNLKMNGIIMESQINSAQMIFGKDKSAIKILDKQTYSQLLKASKKLGIEPGMGHKYYEKIRTLNPDEEMDQIIKLTEESIEYYKKIRSIKIDTP